MIELIDFGKDYGDFTAVERLNLKIFRIISKHVNGRFGTCSRMDWQGE